MKQHVAMIPTMLLGVWAFHLIVLSVEPGPASKLEPTPTPAVDVAFNLQQANQLFGQGFALHQSGDMQGALDTYKEALALFRSAEDRAAEVITGR